jgi:hypothetical protein
MRAIDRWYRLSRDQRLLTLQAAAAVAIVRLALPLIGVKRLMRLTATRLGKPSNRTQAEDWVVAMDRAGRYVPGATCLSKSVALCWVLRRCGCDVLVRIGARRKPGFAAHAWIERDGQPLTPAHDGAGRFTAVLSSDRLKARD